MVDVQLRSTVFHMHVYVYRCLATYSIFIKKNLKLRSMVNAGPATLKPKTKHSEQSSPRGNNSLSKQSVIRVFIRTLLKRIRYTDFLGH